MPGYGSAEETATGGALRECGWGYEEETYRGSGLRPRWCTVKAAPSHASSFKWKKSTGRGNSGSSVRGFRRSMRMRFTPTSTCDSQHAESASTKRDVPARKTSKARATQGARTPCPRAHAASHAEASAADTECAAKSLYPPLQASARVGSLRSLVLEQMRTS